ncbi:hypothetical protein ACLOJK_036195 [Asimina triloba]
MAEKQRVERRTKIKLPYGSEANDNNGSVKMTVRRALAELEAVLYEGIRRAENQRSSDVAGAVARIMGLEFGIAPDSSAAAGRDSELRAGEQEMTDVGTEIVEVYKRLCHSVFVGFPRSRDGNFDVVTGRLSPMRGPRSSPFI